MNAIFIIYKKKIYYDWIEICVFHHVCNHVLWGEYVTEMWKINKYITSDCNHCVKTSCKESIESVLEHTVDINIFFACPVKKN